jgi:hypothetical protein
MEEVDPIILVRNLDFDYGAVRFFLWQLVHSEIWITQ